ncbi:MAG: 23S rRNA (uracil(1939)-C(5))-methyltransferase RlmD [Bacteroidota bacterium]
MAKGKNIEKLQITGISADGKSVGRKEGLVVFVRGGAPGDVVDVRITGKRKKFLEGVVVKMHQSSPDRVKPFCEHFGVCGGCKWQHINYDAQLRYKQNHVAENLKKLTDVPMPEVIPILGTEPTTYYRNKLEFTFSNRRWLTKEEIDSEEEFSRNALGFHIPKMFDKVLNIDHCHLQATPSNAIRLQLKAFAEREELPFYDLKSHQGFLRNLIIRTTSTGEVMVIVQFAEDDKKRILRTLTFLDDEFPEITSLNYVVNTKLNDTFYDLPVINYTGRTYIQEQMGNLTFRIGPKSFYQTNSKQAHELYNLALEFAGLQGDEVVYDLYTGTGTIANFVAADAKKVVGIESVPEAVEDAKINSSINQIDNTDFYAGDMKDLLTSDFIESNGSPDVVITDPPRAGMHKNVIKVLNELKAPKIVYVSCNPATQARDIQDLSVNYEVTKIQPVDMFPHTHHVECVVLLELSK